MRRAAIPALFLTLVIGILVFASPSLSNQVREPYKYVILKASFHAHTTYSDGAYTPEQLVDYYENLDYDVLAITDHNTVDGYDRAKAQGDLVGMTIIKGEEITCMWPDGGKKHIVALFINSVIPAGSSGPYWRTVEFEWYFKQIHLQGGLGIVAHPLREGTWKYWKVATEKYYMNYVVDGFEVYNGNLSYTQWTLNNGKLCLYSHDFHKPSSTPANAFTLIMAENDTIEGVREALYSGRVVYSNWGSIYGSPKALSLYVELVKANKIRIMCQN